MQRVTLPHISASLPSELKILISKSASCDGKSSTRPSAPMPKCLSHTAIAACALSGKAYLLPSTKTKSFPQPCHLLKENCILIPSFLKPRPFPSVTALQLPKTASSIATYCTGRSCSWQVKNPINLRFTPEIALKLTRTPLNAILSSTFYYARRNAHG